MSYSIRIGEMYMQNEPEDGYVFVNVQHAEVDSAPNPSDSGKRNTRDPGYSQMSNWCDGVGLKDLFFDESEGLLRPHPGCRPLSQKHLDKVKLAIDRLGLTVEQCYEICNKQKNETETEIKAYRLGWYYFWMEWALKNCKNPGVYNR